jgi:hypothetical protein
MLPFAEKFVRINATVLGSKHVLEEETAEEAPKGETVADTEHTEAEKQEDVSPAEDAKGEEEKTVS